MAECWFQGVHKDYKRCSRGFTFLVLLTYIFNMNLCLCVCTLYCLMCKVLKIQGWKWTFVWTQFIWMNVDKIKIFFWTVCWAKFSEWPTKSSPSDVGLQYRRRPRRFHPTTNPSKSDPKNQTLKRPPFPGNRPAAWTTTTKHFPKILDFQARSLPLLLATFCRANCRWKFSTRKRRKIFPRSSSRPRPRRTRTTWAESRRPQARSRRPRTRTRWVDDPRLKNGENIRNIFETGYG